MTAQNEITAGIAAAMAEIENIAKVEESLADEPKPKQKRKPKKAEDVKAETSTKPEPKPAAPTLDGYELKEGADPEEIRAATSEAADAADAILRKDADLLDAYLDLGAFNAKAAKAFKSTKLMGQYIAEKVPASQSLDPALRSNCKWLWEALNDPAHDAYGDLLRRLGVNDLKSFKSANPTVIRREYTLLVKAEEDKAKAEELGIESDEPAKAIAKAQKEKDDELFNEALAESLEIFADKLTKGSFTKADIAHSLVALLRQVVPAKRDAALEALNVFKLEKAPKASLAAPAAEEEAA